MLSKETPVTTTSSVLPQDLVVVPLIAKNSSGPVKKNFKSVSEEVREEIKMNEAVWY